MKRIYKTLFTGTLGVTLLLSSCNFDNNKPSGSLPNDEAISSLDLMETATRGFYTELATHPQGPAGQGGLYADAKGGDIKKIGRSNNFAPVLTFNCDKNSGSANGTYFVYANLLGRTNKIIELSDKVADKDKDMQRFNHYLGEAYAMRAYGHFELARGFAELPVAAKDINGADTGIPLQLKYNDEKVVQKRNTIDETYKSIIADLNKALTLLDKKRFDKLQMNYWSTAALLARAYLYTGDYANALKYAKEVINGSGAKLYNVENYIGSWTKSGADESLFEVGTTEKANAQRNSLGYQTNPEGYAEAAASDSYIAFVNSLPAGDIRKQMISERSDDGDQKGWYSIKYMGQDGVANKLYVNNGRVLRLSEMYLIVAEAALKLGNMQEATKYYNDFVSNRIANATPVTAITIDDILDQRRAEFFCENHRMFDLVRNKKDINTDNVKEKVVKYDNLKMVLMAIPEREINISKGAMKQNPGW